MSDSLKHCIAQWFADHDLDSEFVIHERPSPYSVVGPPHHASKIVIVTKPTTVLATTHDSGAFDSMGLIGGYGLPTESDFEWMHRLCHQHELLFLGDMDPVDLLVFGWLREQLLPQSIAFLGVSDRYLAALQVTPPESYFIQLSDCEREALSLVGEVFPDLESMIGSGCAGLLNRGQKIEIEAVVSTLRTLGSPATILTPAISN